MLAIAHISWGDARYYNNIIFRKNQLNAYNDPKLLFWQERNVEADSSRLEWLTKGRSALLNLW